MNIPVNEQETVINFTRDSDEARIYTTDRTVRTKLRDLACRNSKDWKLVRQDTDSTGHDVIAETYSCPKSLISFRTAKRVFTDEQRREMAERLKRARMQNNE
jgi:hypothetical protein